MVSVVPTSRYTGRYKGSRVHHSTVRTQFASENSLLPLPVVGTTGKTKTCFFCKDAGHSLGLRCLKIYCWKGTMLTRNKNETAQRDEFVKQLRNPGLVYSITMLPINKFQSNAINEIGQGARSLVLHARYVIYFTQSPRYTLQTKSKHTD